MSNIKTLAITIDQLSLKRGLRALTNPISFTILPGTALLVNGMNGIGKTTFLRTLAGFISAPEGNILCNQMPITTCMDEYLQLITYCGHNLPVKDFMTLEENMLIWAAIYNHELCLEAALHCFDLTSKRHMLVKNLSQGWKQRLKLSRLLLSSAKIWLLDEPVVNLDRSGTKLIEQLINGHTARGNIAIIATNNEINLQRAAHFNLNEVAI
jgi:heme exporter protein A